MKLARQDMANTFGIIIYDTKFQHSNEAMESVLNIEYPKNKYKVVISSSHNQKASDLFNYINTMRKSGTNCELIINFSNDVEKDSFKAIYGVEWIVLVNSEYTIPKDILMKIVEENAAEEKDFFCGENFLATRFSLVNSHYLDYNSLDKTLETIMQKSISSDKFFMVDENQEKTLVNER